MSTSGTDFLVSLRPDRCAGRPRAILAVFGPRVRPDLPGRAVGSPGATPCLSTRIPVQGARPCQSEPLRDKSIVVTGVTGQVAEPVAVALAKENQVVGAARFRDEAARQRLEAAGVRCVPIDLASGDVAGLPADADYVDQLRRVQDQRLGRATSRPTAAAWPG